jgi:hypothetical protein
VSRPNVSGDLARGDLGTAKSRLISSFINSGYDPAVCGEIGDLCRDMLDPTEAGRWYFVSDRPTIEVEHDVGAFVSKHGGRVESILKQIPSKAKLDDMEAYPAAARERLRAIGCDWAPGDGHRKVAGLDENRWQTNPRPLAIGLRTVLIWLRSALGIP